VTQTAPRLHSKTVTEPGFIEAPTPIQTAAAPEAINHLWLLWNRRRFLSRAALVGLLFGTLVAFNLPKQFQSTTQLMPPDTQSSSGMAMLAALGARTGSGLGALAGDLLEMKSSGALFIGILRSRTVEDRLVDRFNLTKVYGASLKDMARRALEANTLISEDPKSGIIRITVTDGDPERAAEIAHAYVEELDHLVAELSTSSAHRERVFLEERLQAVKQELDQASKDFSEFASKNAAIDIKEQGRAMVDAAASLMGQMIAAESELKGLEAIYTPNNVRVRSVQARLTELRRQLQEKMGNKDGAETAESGAAGDTPYPTLRKLPLLGVTYGDLYRRTKIQEAVYETLTQEYELAKVQEAKETPSVKVLDIAKVPERKSFPPRLLIMVLFSFMTLAGAVVFILSQARWAEVDSGHSGKILVQEVVHTVGAHMPWATPNGSRFQTMTHKVWVRLDRLRNRSDRLPPDQN
jgi:capsule polysaccharide export protein KpsE/RkpR